MNKNGPFIYNKITTKKMIIYYFSALSILMFYGFYKNGIFLYNKDLIGFAEMFKPLLLPIIGFVIGYVIEYLNCLITHKNWKEIMFNSFYGVYGVLASFIVEPDINILYFIVLCIMVLGIFRLINNKLTIRGNVVCLVSLALILCSELIGSIDYKNAYEVLDLNVSTLKTIFFGKCIGGINSTSVVLIIIGFIFLVFASIYKSEIPIAAFVTYLVILLVYHIITGNINDAFIKLFTDNYMFNIVFIAPLCEFSPTTLKGKIIFGIGIGVLTFALSFIISPLIGVLISILIFSFFSNLFDKIA